MGFLPTTTNLGQVDEYKNVNYTITYTDALNVSYPVTVSAIDINSTVTVESNKITGYYTESFDDTVYYRNKDDTFDTVAKFSQVDTETYSELVKYTADTTAFKDYTYLATANGESQVYTVVVTNNWTNGRNNMLSFLAGQTPAVLANIVVGWTNSSNQVVTWTNNVGTTIKWLNNQ